MKIASCESPLCHVQSLIGALLVWGFNVFRKEHKYIVKKLLTFPCVFFFTTLTALLLHFHFEIYIQEIVF